MGLENLNNGLVPNNARVLPEQAFIDMFDRILTGDDAITLGFGGLRMAQFTAGTWLGTILTAKLDRDGSSIGSVNFTDNDLDSTSISAIVDACIDFSHDNVSTGTLGINGGTNAAPNPSSVTTLEGNGWTVAHN